FETTKGPERGLFHVIDRQTALKSLTGQAVPRKLTDRDFLDARHCRHRCTSDHRTFMQPPNELQRAEIMDWWEAAQDHISKTIPDRLPALYYKVDQKIDEMSWHSVIFRKRSKANEINKIVDKWIERLYSELTHDIEKSYKISARKIAKSRSTVNSGYSDLFESGATAILSIAPFAAYPMLAGGMTTAGVTFLGFTIGGGTIMLAPALALLGATALFCLGFFIRSMVLNGKKKRMKKTIHESINEKALGNPKNLDETSLKGLLLEELKKVAKKRLECVK
ncbi:MAG: hypothetical protein VXW58_09855, partial [Pseudomonadota bacterium]|nr:hypothetical protein [Pseudomonadota bacterium]